MKKSLNSLLQDIDPSRTLDPMEERLNEALTTLRVENPVLDDWDQFRMFLAKCYCNMERKALRISSEIAFDKDRCWTRCMDLLNAEYGPSGPRTAFEICRTGVEGGLYSVLKSMAKRMAHEYATKEIQARVGIFLVGLSVDEELETCNTYLEEYGHLLPHELTEESAARIKSNFARVLEAHPDMIRRIRKGFR